MQPAIYTIGYEGSDLEDFIATLLLSGITTLIDVRELPLSRKKGFSKNILAEALEVNDIEYVHLKGLGDPKEGRDAAKAGEHEKFLAIFKKHLETDIAKKDLAIAQDIVLTDRSCLLCYERDPKCCHRNLVVAKLIKKTGQEIKHLGVQKNARSKVTLYLNDVLDYA